MKKTYLLLIGLLLLLASCGNREQPALEGLWLFHSSGVGDHALPDCFLNLKKNGRYTLFIPDYFDYGYWKKDDRDSSIILFASKRKPLYYGKAFTMRVGDYTGGSLNAMYTLPQHIERASGGGSFAAGQVSVPASNTIVLARSEVQYPDSLDPYSYSLNRWRMKPDSLESCVQLSRRTANYLRHMYALFLGQHQQQSRQYGYPYSPSPLLYGQNGIATIDFYRIPAYWKQTFYNNSQAKQGCAILYAIFDEKLDIPKGYKRPDELWARLLKQMASYAATRDYCAGGNGPDTAVVD
jgi:hypothetical protein